MFYLIRNLIKISLLSRIFRKDVEYYICNRECVLALTDFIILGG